MVALVIGIGLMVTIVTMTCLESYLVYRKMRHWSNGQKSFHHWLTENVFWPKSRRMGIIIAGATTVGAAIIAYLTSDSPSDMTWVLLFAIVVSVWCLGYGMIVDAPRTAYRTVCLIETIGQELDIQINWWRLDEKRFSDWHQYKQWPEYLRAKEAEIIPELSD